MLLTEKDKQSLLSEFPKNITKLSYNNSYNKVYRYDFLVAIPEGIACFLWFTHYNNKDLCILLEIDNSSSNNFKIQDIFIQKACFNNELCYGNGSILYGTFFLTKGGFKHFSLENIFYYKGKNLLQMKMYNKLKLYDYIFQNDIQQIIYNKSFLIIGLAFMFSLTNTLESSEKEFLKIIKEGLISYRVKYIEFHYFHETVEKPIFYINYDKTKPTLIPDIKNNNINNYNVNVVNKNNNLNKNTINTNAKPSYKPTNKIQTLHSSTNISSNKKEIVFQIRPDIQNDIYHLYTDNGTKLYGKAHIPDFTTSVKMNKLFRNIKENEKLDALEESDDEAEFENEKEDKFVFLERKINMVCHFSYKFKKWIPIKVAKHSSKIIESKELFHLEKNKY